MTYTVSNPVLSGKINAIPSKSHLHRLLIAAALYGSKTEIRYEGEQSEDIAATIRCLRELDAQIETAEPSGICVTQTGRNLFPNKTRVLHCGESGSTLRFLLPVVGALGLTGEFYAAGRLPQRPLSPLREELIRHGCEISESGKIPLTVKGRLNGGVFEIAGGVSSQYITGLLLALPLLEEKCEICVSGALESRPYVDMTLDVLSQFGVNVAGDHETVFRIGRPAGRSASGKRIFYAEGDWSNAAFWLTAGAVGSGKLCVSGLSLSSKQGDKMILEILKRFGAAIEIQETGNGLCDVTVSPSALKGIEIDAADIPDLVPILSLAAACAEGRTVIRNAGRLRFKESDRLHSVSEMLGILGARIRQTEDGLMIDGAQKYGGSPLKGGTVSSYNDHRIAMTAAVAGTVAAGAVSITYAEAVNKSYPQFWNAFEKLNRK